MRLQTKVLIGITGLVMFAVLAVGGITVVAQQRLLKDEMRQHQESLSYQLARVCEESLYQSNLVFMNYSQALLKERGFKAAFFVDNTGVLQIHSDPLQRHDAFTVPMTLQPYQYEAPVSFSGKKVGMAYLQFDPLEIKRFLDQSRSNDIRRIGFISLLVLALSLPLVYFYTKSLLKPVLDVIRGMKEISEGRRDNFPVSGRSDELGWMENELNSTIHKLREVEEIKSDFILSVTHDLTSPLKNIQSIHAMLMDRTDMVTPEQLRELLLNAQNSSDRLMRMIHDLLRASRIESGELMMELTLFDIRKSIEEVAALYKVEAAKRGLPLIIGIPNKPTYVYADKEKVGHILLNLMSNAFKFTSTGSIGLGAKENEEGIHVTVSDSGTGIPESDKEEIFEKFYRSQSNAKRAIGTGLGLYIVKGYVEAHGGSVLVRDNPGGGTIFEFNLPKEEKGEQLR